MPNEQGEPTEINLGEVSGEELLIAGYESLKMVLASAVAQLAATEPSEAKAIFAAIANDCDVERAKFIIAMRADAKIVDGEVEDG